MVLLQNQTKFADVELTSDHAEQCIYTYDFIESQISGDDFDEWYSDVYPFCTGNSPRPFHEPLRTAAGTDELIELKKFLRMDYPEIVTIH